MLLYHALSDGRRIVTWLTHAAIEQFHQITLPVTRLRSTMFLRVRRRTWRLLLRRGRQSTDQQSSSRWERAATSLSVRDRDACIQRPADTRRSIAQHPSTETLIGRLVARRL